MPDTTPLVIIGAGPGGYTAAFHAADLGLAVTLIDPEKNPGGVCLYRGCIPSKALLHAAKTLNETKEAGKIGIETGTLTINLDKLRSWKESVVAKLTGGLGALTKQRKINYIQGQARFINPNTLEIKKNDGSIETIAFQQAILATGSRPIHLPILTPSPKVWDSTAALALPRIPASLLVIGGGYIGLELGSAYSALGAKVDVVEALPLLIGGTDRDLAEVLIRRLKKNFTSIMTGTKLLAASETSAGINATFQGADGKTFLRTYDQILSAVGRQPNTEGLGLDKAGIMVNPGGFIQVNAQCQTTRPHIFAIGDVTGQPLLAHKASAEAKVAIESIAGKTAAFNPQAIPAVIFTDPELAWTGLTEAEARTKGLDITVASFPWLASGRALTIDRTDGLTKIIADRLTKRILGVGIVGAGAGELIAEGTLAITMNATADDLARTIHPHPTLSETVMETAEDLFGHCTHLLKTRAR
ncbi:MAG: dihydrolipoyl dehydrogenase [Candidatus Omnitrophica bacterium]|nr:dihydrolipoyl dehydrogenase [Candidatus Omnitrophota bacterium]